MQFSAQETVETIYIAIRYRLNSNLTGLVSARPVLMWLCKIRVKSTL